MDQTYQLLINPTVRAVQVTPDTIDWAASWCKGLTAKEFDPLNRIENIIGVNVFTQHGVKLAHWGHYIVKKMNGEFKVYDQGTFERKYALIANAEKTIKDRWCKACEMQQCDQALKDNVCPCCERGHI